MVVDEICRVGGIDRARAEREQRASWSSLVEAAERAKCRLSSSPGARIALTAFEIECEIEASAVEVGYEKLLRRMEVCIRRAMADAKLTPSDIEEVLLVGGATRMPVVEQLAARIFSRLPKRNLPPDEAVALGAAVQAAIKADDPGVDDMVVTDIAPFTLGVDIAQQVGRSHVQGVFSPIIDRGTMLPASRSASYHTLGDRQTVINLGVYQGEHSMVARNQKLGELELTGIPARPAGEETVEVRFTYDLNGLLEVQATVASTGKSMSLVLGKRASQMSAAEVAAARKAMERLKFHPKDALPNTTAIERAESLYTQLTGDSREFLGQMLAQFRGVLDSQDPAQIDTARAGLVRLTRELQD